MGKHQISYDYSSHYVKIGQTNNICTIFFTNSGGWTYFPHSAAVSIALALAAAQSPLVHDGFVVYQISSQSFLLAFPVSSVTYFLLWAILWLFLTLAKDWKFNITVSFMSYR